MNWRKTGWLAGALAGMMLGAVAAEPMVGNGDRLAVIGDSITEQKIYTNNIETYVLACSGLRDVKVMSFGWSGERAGNYLNRMAVNQKFFPATVATTFYGMNDGNYRAYDPRTGEQYRQNSEKIAQFLKQQGVRLLAGSPGAVDSDTFRRGGSEQAAEVYNHTLQEMGKLGSEAAKTQGAQFVDVHEILMSTMAKAKAKYGKGYHVCGGDGVHPAANGQLVIAYAFLKNLGFDGEIARIEMDFPTGKTAVNEGHQVLSFKPGSVELESVRYPFVFSVGNDPNRNSSILAFCPFNQDLNRFLLVVRNLPAARATVQFGEAKKTFTREELEQGINLAEEFAENNPFRRNFEALSQAVRRKQDFETWVTKTYLVNFERNLPAAKTDAKLAEALKVVDQAVHDRWNEFDAQARAAITPVKYTITVTPEA